MIIDTLNILPGLLKITEQMNIKHSTVARLVLLNISEHGIELVTPILAGNRSLPGEEAIIMIHQIWMKKTFPQPGKSINAQNRRNLP